MLLTFKYLCKKCECKINWGILMYTMNLHFLLYQRHSQILGWIWVCFITSRDFCAKLFLEYCSFSRIVLHEVRPQKYFCFLPPRTSLLYSALRKFYFSLRWISSIWYSNWLILGESIVVFDFTSITKNFGRLDFGPINFGP